MMDVIPAGLSNTMEGRRSSISLMDSVIRHLDLLLARSHEESDWDSVAYSASGCATDSVSSGAEVGCGKEDKSAAVGATEEIQHVMDLSFASVYELPPLPSASAELCHVTSDVDSGVESKSDVTSVSENEGDVALQHDYQNLKPIQRRNNNNNDNNSLAGRSRRSRRKESVVSDTKQISEQKFYEICLGHFCLQLDCGSDRKISIYSLQKHSDELNGSTQQQHQSSRKSQQQTRQQQQPQQPQQQSQQLQQKNLHQRQSSTENTHLYSNRKNGEQHFH